MAIRWRDRGKGEMLCAAIHPKQDMDLYIDDELHYWLAVIAKVLVPDEDEKNNGRWHWKKVSSTTTIDTNPQPCYAIQHGEQQFYP